MLLNSLWTEHGLVNCREGELIDIVWPVGLDGDPRDSPTLFVLMAFDDLPPDAPEVFRYNEKKVVPIWPVRRDALQRIGGGPVHCMREATKAPHTSKTRCPKILPFDHWTNVV